MIRVKKSKFLVFISLTLCGCLLFTGTAFAAGDGVLFSKENVSAFETTTGSGVTVQPEVTTASGVTVSYDESIIHAAAQQRMQNRGKSGELLDPVLLYNMNDELECICYRISSDGYIKVNVKNYEILEYSPEGDSDVHQFLSNVKTTPKFYINGPFITFYDKGDGNLAELDTGAEYPKTEFQVIYDNKPEKKMSRDFAARMKAAPRSASSYPSYVMVTQKWSNYTPGSGHYMCVPVASALMLEYYHRVRRTENGVSCTYLPAYIGYPNGVWRQPTRDEICHLLTNTYDVLYEDDPPYPSPKPYVSNYTGGLSIYDTVKGTDSAYYYCKGMQQYFSDYCNTTLLPYYVSSYNYYTICYYLDNKRPVCMNVNNGIPNIYTGGRNHAVVMVGHYDDANGMHVMVVNDGHGNNQVETAANSEFYADYYYFGPRS